MFDFDEFFKRAGQSQGIKVIGTYLYPHRLFGNPDWNNPYTATEVIKRVNVGKEEVLITCNGGLFMIPQDNIIEFKDKLDFQVKAINTFNCLICEFALNGIVSEPATPAHISMGRLIEDHIVIMGAGGGHEIYLERTMEPLLHLIQGRWIMWPCYSLDKVEEVIKQKHISLLIDVSTNLPTPISSAYSLFSQRQNAEAMSDSWIVIEQILDSLWMKYISEINNPKQKERLEDTRTYTSAIRIELDCTPMVGQKGLGESGGIVLYSVE